MNLGWSVAALSLSVVFLGFAGRYELAVSTEGVFRGDRLTGEITRCAPSSPGRAGAFQWVCGTLPDYLGKPSARGEQISDFEVLHPEAAKKQKEEWERLLKADEAWLAEEARRKASR